MTQRHFEAIASEIAALDLVQQDKRAIAEAMARVCKRFNPRFNSERFHKACGTQCEEDR